MKRGKLYLIDWDEASAAEAAQALEADGWSVRIESIDGARAVKHMMDDPADVVAIDLSRLPSHGRETARAVRGAKVTAATPIVFYGGADDARSKAAGAVPDATLTTAEDLPHVLARLAMRPAEG
ncbi:MAG TPA: hypothetical protein VM841_13815 [Actinomycetota bacterium]|nr:hypothetical protein [Actinomycetota bacterium]